MSSSRTGAINRYLWKILLLGDGSVGKSSIRSVFIGEEFKEMMRATIGADITKKTMDIDGNMITYVIYDLAGQPHFEVVRDLFYLGAQGALLVFDITNKRSLYSIHEGWVNSLYRLAGHVPAVLVGNKIDLETERTVTKEEVEELLKTVVNDHAENLTYIKTSAKTGENIEKSFKILGELILEIKKKQKRKTQTKIKHPRKTTIKSKKKPSSKHKKSSKI